MAKCGRKPRLSTKLHKPVGAKRCPECGETKVWTEFHRWAYSKDGLQVYCKECMRKRQAAVRARRKLDRSGTELGRRHLRALAEFPVVTKEGLTITVKKYGRVYATVKLNPHGVMIPSRGGRRVRDE